MPCSVQLFNPFKMNRCRQSYSILLQQNWRSKNRWISTKQTGNVKAKAIVSILLSVGIATLAKNEAEIVAFRTFNFSERQDRCGHQCFLLFLVLISEFSERKK